MVVVAASGEVREFPLSDQDRLNLLAGAARGEKRLAAVWTQAGGPTRYVVRAGVGPWPPPEEGAPEGLERWAREDAAATDGAVRYRAISENPWKTLEMGLLDPAQLAP